MALNLSNRLAEFDAATGDVLRLWDVGVAPYDVVLVGDKAYVSNWGGRRPGPAMPHRTRRARHVVRVDPVRFIANEGSVTVDRSAAANAGRTGDIMTGLHASRHWRCPRMAGTLVVANAAATPSASSTPAPTRSSKRFGRARIPADLFGASPNALAFDQSGKTLYVCNGTQNAVAVVDFDPGKSKLLGSDPGRLVPGRHRARCRRATASTSPTSKASAQTKASDQRRGLEFNSHSITARFR